MNLTTLSKAIAYALRHRPDTHGLTLDQDGWVQIDALAGGLRVDPRWAEVDAEVITRLVQDATKQRYEIQGDLIRACYGHSNAFPQRIRHPPAIPPPRLFHATTPERAASILDGGLWPMSRQYVHLSCTSQIARDVGERSSVTSTVLVIDAARAHGGIVFYRTKEPRVWLADHIPACYLHPKAGGLL